MVHTIGNLLMFGAACVGMVYGLHHTRQSCPCLHAPAMNSWLWCVLVLTLTAPLCLPRCCCDATSCRRMISSHSYQLRWQHT
jgi:hypothetical protein